MTAVRRLGANRETSSNEVVRAAAGQLDDLANNLGVESDRRVGKGLSDRSIGTAASRGPSVSGWKKRTSGSWADRTSAKRLGDAATTRRGDLARIQLEGARAQLQQNIARGAEAGYTSVERLDEGALDTPRFYVTTP